MQKLPYRVQTYSGNFTPYTVYALNKGNNSGKPSFTPYRNCFAVICDDYDTAQQMYCLLTLLHKGRLLEPFLNGSVILFLHIKDLKDILKQYAHLHGCTDLQKRVKGVLSMSVKIVELETMKKRTQELLFTYTKSMLFELKKMKIAP